MYERIESKAWISVARGCGFAMLAMLTTMVGLLGEPPIALRTGGVLALLTTMVLLLKASLAGTTRHQDTEVWLMLAPGERPVEPIAQKIIATIRREVLLRFAYHFAVGSAIMSTAGLLLGIGTGDR